MNFIIHLLLCVLFTFIALALLVTEPLFGVVAILIFGLALYLTTPYQNIFQWKLMRRICSRRKKQSF